MCHPHGQAPHKYQHRRSRQCRRARHHLHQPSCEGALRHANPDYRRSLLRPRWAPKTNHRRCQVQHIQTHRQKRRYHHGCHRLRLRASAGFCPRASRQRRSRKLLTQARQWRMCHLRGQAQHRYQHRRRQRCLGGRRRLHRQGVGDSYSPPNRQRRSRRF